MQIMEMWYILQRFSFKASRGEKEREKTKFVWSVSWHISYFINDVRKWIR